MIKNELFRWIKNWEGIGAPDQPTIYGITEANYPDYYYRIQTLVETKMPKELINIAVYDAYEHIYKQSNAHKLYFPLNWIYFDFFFNSGYTAGKLLQETLNKKWGNNLIMDGIVGKKTIGAIKKVKDRRLLCMQYIMRRIEFVSVLKEHHGLINRISKLSNFIWSNTFKT